MANEIEKVNTIAITDIEKVNGKTDDNIEKLNALEFAGVSIPGWAGTRAVLLVVVVLQVELMFLQIGYCIKQ